MGAGRGRRPGPSGEVRKVMSGGINLELLLKLRLVVARFGEMDVAKWWNTRRAARATRNRRPTKGFPSNTPFRSGQERILGGCPSLR